MKFYDMADVDDFGELNILDQRKQTLKGALGESARGFDYEHDLGDSWCHRVAVKPLARPNPSGTIRCAPAARGQPLPTMSVAQEVARSSSPPSKDPRHEEHENMLIRIGGVFDPEGFDLNAINRTLHFGPLPATQIPPHPCNALAHQGP